MVQHIESSCAEFLHDQLRCPRPDPLDHAGGKIALDALLCLGQYLLIAFHLQLQPVLTLYPSALEVGFRFVRVRQAGACRRELEPFPLIAGVPCRLRHAAILRVVHEDTETVVLVMKNFLYIPASHPFSPPALFLPLLLRLHVQPGHRQGYPVPLPF